MVDETKAAKKKPAKKPGKLKADEKKMTYIFFGILVVIIIAVSVIILIPKNTKRYVATFGSDIVTTIEIKEKEKQIRMLVKIKDNEPIEQKGTLVFLTSAEDKDDPTKSYTIYEATFEPLDSEEDPEVVQIKVFENSLLLAYDSGEIIEYEVKK